MRFLIFVFAFLTLLLLPPQLRAATDQDYENSGEKIMDQMMVTRHQQADNNIKETMGEDFLKQMHIAMGKMAEKNAAGTTNLGMMPMTSMMIGGGGFNMMGGNYGMMGGSGFWLFGLLAWLTWILIIIALILGIVWLWKQIQKK